MFTQPPQPLAHTLLVQHQMKPSKMRRYARREENRHLHEKNESSSAVHIVPDQPDKSDDDDIVLNSNQEQNVQSNTSDKMKINESYEKFNSPDQSYNDSAVHELGEDDTAMVLIRLATDQSSTCVGDTIMETLLPHRCCFHICEPLSRPAQDDGKCCHHRCRPTWTIHQRSKNYNEDLALLSQSNSNYSRSEEEPLTFGLGINKT